MADKDLNSIQKIKGLQSISGLKPVQQRKEKRQKQQGEEHTPTKPQSGAVAHLDANTEHDVDENNTSNDHIDYRA